MGRVGLGQQMDLWLFFSFFFFFFFRCGFERHTDGPHGKKKKKNYEISF